MKRPTEGWRSTNLFELGLGHVVVSRFKSKGEVEVGVFLVDVFCLGAKDAFFTRLCANEYEDRLLDRLFAETGKEALSPACARKLVEGAVAYAQNLGLAPHPDYKKACRVFGGIHPGECDASFTFGEDGKPSFIQGPNDSPEFVRRTIAALTARCGDGNFHYTVLG